MVRSTSNSSIILFSRAENHTLILQQTFILDNAVTSVANPLNRRVRCFYSAFLITSSVRLEKRRGAFLKKLFLIAIKILSLKTFLLVSCFIGNSSPLLFSISQLLPSSVIKENENKLEEEEALFRRKDTAEVAISKFYAFESFFFCSLSWFAKLIGNR